MKNIRSHSLYNLILSGLFASVTVLCAWITIPTAIPFTLQTLAIFLTALLLEAKYGLLSVFIYISMGLIGLPVFSGFQGGVGVLLGPTGGFIMGFLFIILMSALFRKVFPDKMLWRIISISAGLLLCYLSGTLWFMFVSNADFLSALTICILPCLPFDIIKIATALILYKRLRNIVK